MQLANPKSPSAKRFVVPDRHLGYLGDLGDLGHLGHLGALGDLGDLSATSGCSSIPWWPLEATNNQTA